MEKCWNCGNEATVFFEVEGEKVSLCKPCKQRGDEEVKLAIQDERTEYQVLE